MRPTLGLLFLLLLVVLTVEAAEEPSKDYLWKGLAKLVVETLKQLTDAGDDKKQVVNDDDDDNGKQEDPLEGLKMLPADCGQHLPIPVDPNKTLAAHYAWDGEYPSYVRVDVLRRNISDNKSSQSSCGGVLISDRHVLTAASCIQYPFVTLDANVTTSLNRSHLPQARDPALTYRVSHWCSAPQFNQADFEQAPKSTQRDLAVLFLAKPVALSKHIQPACLPRAPVKEDTRLQWTSLGFTHKDKPYPMRRARRRKYRQEEELLPKRLLAYPVSRVKCEQEPEYAAKICVTLDARSWYCPDDSNGPIYGVEDGRQIVAGIGSYGRADCKNIGKGYHVGSDTFVARDDLGLILKTCQKRTKI